MTAPADLQPLDLAAALAQARPFSRAKVQLATGLALERDEAGSNAFFDVFKGTGRGTVARVEARLPIAREGATARDGLVIVDLSPASCVKEAEVLERFGKNAELQPASPRQPPSAPNYFVYRHDWGTVSFGISREGERCLTSFVVDATGK